jgi:hypothetical protein
VGNRISAFLRTHIEFIALSAAALVGYAIIFVKQNVVESTSADSISLTAAAKNSFDKFTPYSPNETFYVAVLNIFSTPIVQGLLVFSVVLIVVLLLRQKYLPASSYASKTVLLVECVALITASIYFSHTSKEFSQFFVVTLVVLIASNFKYGDFLILYTIFYYQANFRAYYIITLAVYFFLRVLNWKKMTAFRLICSVFCSTVCVALVSMVPNHQELTTIRNFTNASFKFDFNSDGHSLIMNLFEVPQNLFEVFFNLLSAQFRLIVPTPMLEILSLYHILTFFGVLLLGALFCLLIFRTTLLDNKAKEFATAQKLVCFILAFFVTQSVFEPDYGSFLRHLTPFFILWLHLAWIENIAEHPKHAKLVQLGEDVR